MSHRLNLLDFYKGFDLVQCYDCRNGLKVLNDFKVKSSHSQEKEQVNTNNAWCYLPNQLTHCI